MVERNWSSLDQIVADLNLGVDSADAAAVEKKLLQRLQRVHPDTAGEDADPDSAMQIIEALDFVRHELPKSTELAVFEKTVDLFGNALARLNEGNRHADQEHRAEKVSQRTQERVHRRGNRFRIGLGGVAAAATAVFFAPQRLADHPFLTSLMESEFAAPLWLMTLLILGYLWLIVGFVEQRIDERVHYLLDESTWMHALGQVAQTKQLLEPRDVTVHLRESTHLGRGLLGRFTRDPLWEAATEAGRLAVEQGVARGLLVPDDTPRFGPQMYWVKNVADDP